VSKERRLGRGLEALLGQIPGRSGPTTPAVASPGRQPGDSVGSLPVTVPNPYGGAGEDAYGQPPVVPPERSAAAPFASAEPAVPPPTRLSVRHIDSNPDQPREDFDTAEIRSLAESLASHGLLQPVVVRRSGSRYQLIAGERRLRAAIEAGWTDVPVNVVEADDRQVAELAIIENLHRKDLNPLEKAASFQKYLEQYGCTQDELASRLQLDRSTIANLIRLLELPEGVQIDIRQGKITQGHARALLPLGDEHEQVAFSERIQREGLSVRQTEAMVQEMIDAADAEPLAVIARDGTQRRPTRGQSEHVIALEQEFRAALGLKVKLTHNARGRGKLAIHFRNHDEFEQLRAHLIAPAKPAKKQAG